MCPTDVRVYNPKVKQKVPQKPKILVKFIVTNQRVISVRKILRILVKLIELGEAALAPAFRRSRKKRASQNAFRTHRSTATKPLTRRQSLHSPSPLVCRQPLVLSREKLLTLALAPWGLQIAPGHCTQPAVSHPRQCHRNMPRLSAPARCIIKPHPPRSSGLTSLKWRRPCAAGRQHRALYC